MGKQSITLHAKNDGGFDRVTTIEGEVITIGRDVKSHLSVTHDEAVARMHLVIEVKSNGDASAIDLGSAMNVNGVQRNRHQLRVGDVITIGATNIEVVAIREATDSAARLPAAMPPSTPRPAAKAAPKNVPPPPAPASFARAQKANPVVAWARRMVASVVRSALEIERAER